MAPHYHLLVSAKYLNETSDCGYNCPDPSPLSPAPAPSPAAVVRAAAPPIPPLPPPPMYASNKQQLLRTLVIVAASVVATCALLLTYYAVLRRYRSLRRRRRAEAEAEAEQPQPPSDTDDELRQDLLVGGALDEPYHVWHIRTAGLDERTIGAISAVAYRRGEGLVEGTDCAVCLGEFRDGEMLRLLPKCSHAFHIPCIDTWLRSHLNCPLCRAPILSPPPRSPPHAADSNSASSSSPSSAVAAAAAAPEAGQSAAATAAGGNSLVHRTSHRHVMPEEEGEDGIIAAVGPPPALAVAGHQLGSSFSHEESEVWVRIDLGNGGPEDDDGRTRSNDPPAEDGGNGRAELQQVQRSISMDPSALGALLRRMGLVGIAGEDSYRRKPTSEEHPSAAKEGRRRGNNCRGTPLTDAGPPEMPRSMSSSGGRFFLSRFSGRTRGSPFPL